MAARHMQVWIPALSLDRRRGCAAANDVTSTASLDSRGGSAMARCADVRVRDRASRYPQGLCAQQLEVMPIEQN